MTVTRRGRHLRYLLWFVLGSAAGVLIAVGGYWLLARISVPPGAAKAVSAAVSIVVVYRLVTRRALRDSLPVSAFMVFACWYALDATVVALLIEREIGGSSQVPAHWKLALVPASFIANYAFGLLVSRRSTWPAVGRTVVGAAAILLVAASFTAFGAPTQTARAEPAKQPLRMADLFAPGASVLGRSFVIGGLGSSVGAGATLLDPARDAPVAYFARALATHVSSGGLTRWTTVNDSVNGSTIHDGLARDWPVLARSHPDVVVLAYGMNDGAPSQFDTGETYAGAMHDLVTLIGEIRSTGAVPVLLTSPSPNTARFNWSYEVGPTVPQQSPVDTTKPVREVDVPGLGSAPESTRHAAVDAGMRAIAVSLGVDLVDVEPYWLRAVAAYGQDALFNRTEFVHPDLLGHRLSYHAAINAWMSGPSLDYPASMRSVR